MIAVIIMALLAALALAIMGAINASKELERALKEKDQMAASLRAMALEVAQLKLLAEKLEEIHGTHVENVATVSGGDLADINGVLSDLATRSNNRRTGGGSGS